MTRRVVVFGGGYGLRPMFSPALAFMAARVAFDRPGDGGVTTEDLKSLETQISQLGGTMKQGTGELKKAAELFQTETKNLGKVTEETKAKVDEALTANNKNSAALLELQQKFATLEARGGGVGEQFQTIGERFVQSDEFKEGAAKIAENLRPKSYSMTFDGKYYQAASITSATTDAAGSAGAAVPKDRQPGILMPAMRRMTIRDLLMPGSTDSNTVEYVREKGFTNNAASQTAEGAEKAQSDIQLELKQATVVTIAHWMIASKQILADAAALRTLIDTRLRYGLKYKEEDQMLNGTGANSTLSGLIQNSTAYVDQNLTVSAEQYVDVLRQAMLQAFLAEWPATGHILNPADWARIELLKDTTGNYLWADPRNLAQPSMWGLPVVQTQAMRETKFMSGAFTPAAQVFDRENISIEASTEDGDNFRKNMVTILCEERLTMIVYRPEALIYGDFGEWS